jgi:hypothetical protein
MARRTRVGAAVLKTTREGGFFMEKCLLSLYFIE